MMMTTATTREETDPVRAEVRALLVEGVPQAQAGGGGDVAERQQFLGQAEQMLRLHARTDPALVEQSLATLLPLRLDPSPPLRRALPAFIDALLPSLLASSSSHPPAYPLLAELMRAVTTLMEDDSTIVARRAIQCAACVLPDMLRTIARTSQVAAGQELWSEILRMKQILLQLLATARHPAIRVQLVKLLENFILCFSTVENRKWAFSLEDVPSQHSFLALPTLIKEGRECLNTLITLAKRSGSDRTAGEKMAAINCLAQVIALSPANAGEIIPHLDKIDYYLSLSLEPGSLTIARQTLKLAFNYILKLPASSANGFAVLINTAIQSIGTQHDRQFEQEKEPEKSASTAVKRKAEELGTIEDTNKLGRTPFEMPPAKRQALDAAAQIPVLSGVTGRDALSTEITKSNEPLLFSPYGGTNPEIAATSLPPLGMPKATGFPVASPNPFAGGVSPLSQPTGPGPAPIPQPASSGGGGMGELGIPPPVLSRFVLDHVAHLPSSRELVRNEPLPPMDIENLVKLLGVLTAARLQMTHPEPAQTQTSITPVLPSGAAVPIIPRDPRARKEEEQAATVPPIPGYGAGQKVEQISAEAKEKPKPAVVKVAQPVLPIPTIIPTIGPIPLSEADITRQFIMTMMRIVKSENQVAAAGAASLRRALVARLATIHPLESEIASQLIEHIAQNLSQRYELALEWLYQEAVRAIEQDGQSGGLDPMDLTEDSKEKVSTIVDSENLDRVVKTEEKTVYAENTKYNESNGVQSGAGGETWGKGKYGELLRRTMAAIDEQELSPPQETIYCHFLASVPFLTPDSLTVIENYVASGRRVNLGLSLLRDLILDRPSIRTRCLNALLSYTLHSDESIRGPAVRLVSYKLFTEESLVPPIQQFAHDALSSFVNAQPMEKEGFEEDQKDKDGETSKEEDKELILYFALCMKKPELLNGLLEIYSRAGVRVKKLIHKQAPQVIRAIGMSHPYIQQMIRNFPKGAETFVLQALHLLTDQAAPTPELTEAVKEVYLQRTQDARFLIPVLSGLSKDEIISNLPKLINLAPPIVKNVIHRVLHNKPTPITPEELLVALHVVDQDKKEKEKIPLRKVVEAIQYCMEQKEYTHGILAIVLQQLIDVSPLPALIMRTIIQTVTKYPKVTGFIMGLLGRLIAKQVWTDERLWQGWVRCCRLTAPNSYLVILQLPPNQLEDVLTKHPDLKQPLAQYHQANPSLVPRASLALLGLV